MLHFQRRSHFRAGGAESTYVRISLGATQGAWLAAEEGSKAQPLLT
jgi:hypothetical protein